MFVSRAARTCVGGPVGTVKSSSSPGCAAAVRERVTGMAAAAPHRTAAADPDSTGAAAAPSQVGGVPEVVEMARRRSR